MTPYGEKLPHMGDRVVRVKNKIVSETDALIAYINAERGGRGWSVAKLAESSGIPLGTLNRRLSSEPRNITMNEIQKLATSFGMTASEFIAGAEKRRIIMQKEVSAEAD